MNSSYGLDDPWVDVPVPIEARICTLPPRPNRLQDSVRKVIGSSSFKVVLLVHESYHIPHTSTEFKKT
jgi:hypothetical protein